MSKCQHEPTPERHPDGEQNHCASRGIDWMLWVSLTIVSTGYLAHWLFHETLVPIRFIGSFSHGMYELINKMWWGLALGVLTVSTLAKVPKEFVLSILGRGGGLTGLLRATFAGLLLDLCSHGILLVGMQLYRRGASLGQTMAFLIASPWNSVSLTLILVSLIGWRWVLVFMLTSAGIALVSGFVFEFLVRCNRLPQNPNSMDLPENFQFLREARTSLRQADFDRKFFAELLLNGWSESRMILRWIFFGTVLASGIRALIPGDEIFADWFGPSIVGLALTLVAATITEVCSEGSSPIAADLLNRGGAPGNAMTFLMAGAATDYTEILSLRETTSSWKIALFLPLVTVPQIVVVGWILNHLGR